MTEHERNLIQSQVDYWKLLVKLCGDESLKQRLEELIEKAERQMEVIDEPY